MRASRRGNVSSVPRVSVQLSLASAALILKHVRRLLAPSPRSAGFVVDEGQARELVLLVSGVLEVTAREPSWKAAGLHAEGIQAMSDLLLVSRTFSSWSDAAPVPPQDGNLPGAASGTPSTLALMLCGSLTRGDFHFEF